MTDAKKPYHSKSEMRRIEHMKEHAKPDAQPREFLCVPGEDGEGFCREIDQRISLKCDEEVHVIEKSAYLALARKVEELTDMFKKQQLETVRHFELLEAAKAEIAQLKDTPGGKRIYAALTRIKELEAEVQTLRGFGGAIFSGLHKEREAALVAVAQDVASEYTSPPCGDPGRLSGWPAMDRLRELLKAHKGGA